MFMTGYYLSNDKLWKIKRLSKIIQETKVEKPSDGWNLWLFRWGQRDVTYENSQEYVDFLKSRIKVLNNTIDIQDIPAFLNMFYVHIKYLDMVERKLFIDDIEYEIMYVINKCTEYMSSDNIADKLVNELLNSIKRGKKTNIQHVEDEITNWADYIDHEEDKYSEMVYSIDEKYDIYIRPRLDILRRNLKVLDGKTRVIFSDMLNNLSNEKELRDLVNFNNLILKLFKKVKYVQTTEDIMIDEKISTIYDAQDYILDMDSEDLNELRELIDEVRTKMNNDDLNSINTLIETRELAINGKSAVKTSDGKKKKKDDRKRKEQIDRENEEKTQKDMIEDLVLQENEAKDKEYKEIELKIGRFDELRSKDINNVKDAESIINEYNEILDYLRNDVRYYDASVYVTQVIDGIKKVRKIRKKLIQDNYDHRYNEILTKVENVVSETINIEMQIEIETNILKKEELYSNAIKLNKDLLTYLNLNDVKGLDVKTEKDQVSSTISELKQKQQDLIENYKRKIEEDRQKRVIRKKPKSRKPREPEPEPRVQSRVRESEPRRVRESEPRTQRKPKFTERWYNEASKPLILKALDNNMPYPTNDDIRKYWDANWQTIVSHSSKL